MNGAIYIITQILCYDIYKVLDGAPANVMFYCTKCKPKVKLVLNFFADIQQKQQALDDKLKHLEENFKCSVGSTDKCYCR